jgi:hypothetical protein
MYNLFKEYLNLLDVYKKDLTDISRQVKIC